MRGVRGAFLWALRLSTLVTLGLSLWLLWSTPLGRYYTQNTAAELSLALDRVLRRDFDQDWLDATLTRALAETPADWALAESALEIGRRNGLAPGPAAAEALAAAEARDRSLAGQAGNCLACAAGDASCRMDEWGLSCALGVEITPIGDARVLWQEGRAYARGEAVDEFGVALAGVGLAATVAILASGGASAPVKGGVAIIRVARGAGRVSAPLAARLAGIGRRLIVWERLPRSPRAILDPAAYRAAVDTGALAEGAALAGSLGRLRRAVPPAAALALLPYIDDAGDAQRLARVAEVAGVKSVGVVNRLGKARTLRLTAKLSRTGRTLAELGAVLLAQALALAAALGQAALPRLLRGLLRRRG